MDFISSLNWVDIIVGAIVVRSVYIGIQRGIIAEIFKLVGVLLAVLVTLHYFGHFSEFLQGRLRLSESVANISSYIFLWSAVVLVFRLARTAFGALFHIEAHSVFDKWGGLILSSLRSFLLCSLFVVLLRVSGIEYLVKNTEKSFSGSRIVYFAPKMYEASFYGFISKFFPSEKLNKDAFPLSSFIEKKEKKG